MECFNSTKLSSPCTSSILNLQGSSSLVCNKFSKNSVHTWLLSSPPPKPIFQLDDRLQYRQTTAHRSFRGPIFAEDGKAGLGNWAVPSPSEPKKSMECSGMVLVVGSRHRFGVGSKGQKENDRKGTRMMLGPDIDLEGEESYKCGFCHCWPKGTATPQKGKNIVKESSSSRPDRSRLGALDDVVMGGVSESTFIIDTTGGEKGGPAGLFKGIVSTTNNGGFTSIRTKNFSVPEDLSSYDGLELRLKGDGRRYKLIVRTSRDWDTVGYTASFDTTEGQWQSIRLPFSSFVPVFRARTVSDAPPFDPRSIVSLQLMFSKFEYDGKLNPTFVEGPFQLPVSSIRTFIKDPVTPRFVHVSSAGVTRPDRPGLDLSKQPPAVRLNKELDFILTFKLKGEDLIRESGIPYAIVRPCALTEEPAGADLIFDQGDNITGKISREEIARICIAALESPYALDKTFEVDGITGKELLEQSPVPV
ncbi:protein HIGH CHLOROPHYLL FLUORESCENCE PHENOTYPE 173 [Populus alba x Populus x berolinensis]|uniref:Protein HIGH CHLOROPHYLL FLUORESCENCE PHENOTYPE 173 n=1 Tax=Populus alba x Populus x berolinensis TaxID=444605 RepID=A0AAD6R1N6_9ROSI|nr:protein HIGH CHLOROPHYLL FLUORESCENCE PHENOTYPE 173 [Populus alba x Populus x berolinensis]